MEKFIKYCESILAQTDRKLIGYFCTYTPLEIIHAAGFTPYRIIGLDKPIKDADGYMHANICPYVRSCLDCALEGKIEPLSGVVFVNSCDAMRRFYSVWQRYIPSKFLYLIDLPKRQSKIDEIYFKVEFEKFHKYIEKHFSILISKESLKQSITIYKEMRNLLKQLYAFQNPEPRAQNTEDSAECEVRSVGTGHRACPIPNPEPRNPKSSNNQQPTTNNTIKASDTLKIMNHITQLPPEAAISAITALLKTKYEAEHKLSGQFSHHSPLTTHHSSLNQQLAIDSKQLPNYQITKLPNHQILLLGSIIHHPSIIEIIESCGVAIVADDLCSISRIFEIDTEIEGEPLEILAKAYLNKSPCARMINTENYINKINSLINMHHIKGVIHYTLKFCDNIMYNIPQIKKSLNEQGIKSLFIEGDYTSSSTGQMKTRIEAFVEMIE